MPTILIWHCAIQNMLLTSSPLWDIIQAMGHSYGGWAGGVQAGEVGTGAAGVATGAAGVYVLHLSVGTKGSLADLAASHCWAELFFEDFYLFIRWMHMHRRPI